MSNTILGLDLSTSTGWAIFVDGVPAHCGTITKRIGWDVAEYPRNFILVADDIATQVFALLLKFPGVTDIVIEEINKTSSRFGSRHAQKILDMLHYTVVKTLPSLPIHYINTSDWRKTLGLSVAETRKRAKPFLLELKRLQKELAAVPDKAAKKAAKDKLDAHKAQLRKMCIHGKVDKKSISVAYCNATWNTNFKKGDDDVADAHCQVKAYLLGCHVLSNKDVFNKQGK
jgi:hypothetical protein